MFGIRSAVLAAGCVGIGTGADVLAQQAELIDEIKIMGLARVDGMAFTGISGFDFDPQSLSGIAVSNDTGVMHPVRFFDVEIEMDTDRIIRFVPLRGQALNNPDGSLFEPGQHRPGSVSVVPADPVGDEPYLLWASEGVVDSGQPAGVYEMCTGATFMDRFGVSPYMDYESGKQGPRSDRAYESIALMPDHSVIAAPAQALLQDGPLAVRGSGGTPVRLVHFDYWTATTLHEHVYILEEPPADAPDGAERSLVELIAINGNELLAVESIMVPGQQRSPRAMTELYIISLDGATDVRGVESLASYGGEVTPVSKTFLGDNESLGLTDARYNAGTFWHTLDDGRQSLFLISDNANDTYRPTYVAGIAIEGIEARRPHVIDEPVEPGSGPGPHRYEDRPIGPWTFFDDIEQAEP